MDEVQHLREALRDVLKRVEDLTAERDALKRRVEELERSRPAASVDVFDLNIHHGGQETCPWTGWPA